MKRLVPAILALGAANAAAAADLPYRKAAPPFVPPPPPPALLFQGLYAGVQAGFVGFADRSRDYWAVNNALLFTSKTGHGGGFQGGAHVGYDWRFGSFVGGLVADVTGARAVNDVYDPLGQYAVRNVLGVSGSLRGRVGVVAFDRLLVYATGGLNLADVRHEYRSVFGLRSNKNYLLGSPTVGVGLEYAISDRWSGRVEYRITGLGTSRETTPVAWGLKTAHQAGSGAITAGVSYRFGN